MIFLDFDGTIVDIWERYYQVFLAASNLSGITRDMYIKAKRKLKQDERVANEFHAALSEEYFRKKKLLLEAPYFLKLDKLLLPSAMLLTFFQEYDVRILTARREKELFFCQLKWLELSELQKYTIVLNPNNGVSKYKYLCDSCKTGAHWLVGDSDEEASVSMLANFNVFLVKTGIQGSWIQFNSERCNVINQLSDFIKSMKGQ